ncbi:MAG: hypothetical protein M3Q71_13105 [Chloroflexota bacterium]|nr:hypothetical protein [Chloroflexota bacterium]
MPLRPVVVDAALAVKWVLPEELSGRAQGLYEAAVRGAAPSSARRSCRWR